MSSLILAQVGSSDAYTAQEQLSWGDEVMLDTSDPLYPDTRNIVKWDGSDPSAYLGTVRCSCSVGDIVAVRFERSPSGLSSLPSSANLFVNTITELLALPGMGIVLNGSIVAVSDATGDPTVSAGGAVYMYNQTLDEFTKIGEYESFNENTMGITWGA